MCAAASSALSGPAFTVPACRALRRNGIEGDARITFDGSALRLEGATAGSLILPAEEVVRLRAGIDDSTPYGVFVEARIWRLGAAEPVVLSLRLGAAEGYEAAMAGFARRVVAAAGAGALETGLGDGQGRGLLVLLALPVAGAGAIWAIALRDAPVWQGAVVVLAALAAWGAAWLSFRRGRARTAVSLAEFERALIGRKA